MARFAASGLCLRSTSSVGAVYLWTSLMESTIRQKSFGENICYLGIIATSTSTGRILMSVTLLLTSCTYLFTSIYKITGFFYWLLFLLNFAALSQTQKNWISKIVLFFFYNHNMYWFGYYTQDICQQSQCSLVTEVNYIQNKQSQHLPGSCHQICSKMNTTICHA